MKPEKYPKGSKVYITGLDSSITEGDVRQEFSLHGVVGDVKISAMQCGSSTKKSGYVQMDTRENAAKAIKSLDSKSFKRGEPIGVRPFLSKPTLSLWDLPNETAKLRVCLLEAFSQFGEVSKVAVHPDQPYSNRVKGANVEFRRKKNASVIGRYFWENHFFIPGVPWPIRCELSDLIEDETPELNMLELAEFPPHVAQSSTFENDWAVEWKKLQLQQESERKELERLHQEDRQKFINKMKDEEDEQRRALARLEK
mmetsp:Transcript_38510/g.62403  ORF Transcript_38510/g.62403 Transcript_38510/m.62403 type:complete len:255 (-) Transcript_38510:772-1536(-)